MKRISLLLIILIGSLISSTKLHASHGMGGEITWTCLPTGQFKFEMKFYRDCNGIPGPGTIDLETTVPGLLSIPCALVAQNDISPDGFASNGATSCPTCAQAYPVSPVAIDGLVEEFVYRSAPVTLPGVPPAGGWTFSWGTCCRSNSLTNITGGGSIGFQNRAIMYPYLGTSTSPCFDNSPYFAEKPSMIICTGYPFKYNPNAVDAELDSLVYSWGQPLDDFGSVIPFAPGYSVNSQLPSATQNASNVAATINANTGEITYTSYTGGYFVTVVKVTAYKCGIKVAEIFREINVVLNNNCPNVLTGQNLPPDVNAPFWDPVTGLQTSYIDTVYAGDTVNFNLQITDFDIFSNGVGQTIKLEASGSEFGANFTNPNAGCILPPCATMSHTLPYFFPIGGNVTFNWRTTCDHMEGINTLCTRVSNTYNFVVKASDNYCPANATNISTISITILPAPKLNAPTLRCASVNIDGSVSLSWTKPAVRDSQDTFFSYEIYASLAAGGPWTLVDSVMTDYLLPVTYGYTQSAASLNTFFGTNAQQQSIFYYLKTTSGCFGDSLSNPSNILKTIKLDATLNGVNATILTWNALSTPPLSSHATKYKIYKQFPVGTWTLIDSTALLTYTDTTTKYICNDTVSYRVELSDSTGCISVSSRDGVQIANPNPIAQISPVNPAFCSGGSVILTCTTPGNSYQWSGGLGTASTATVSTTGTYTVTVTQNGGCTSVGSTTVTVNPLPTPVITGNNIICSGTYTTFDAGGPYNTYVWSNGIFTQTNTVDVAGNYTVTVTDINGCSKSTSRYLTVNPLPIPNIAAVSAICQGTCTTLNAGAGYTSYLWSGGLGATQNINVCTAGNYTVTVTNAFNCTASDTHTLTVNPLPNPNITGDNSICQGFTTTFDAGAGFNSYQWAGGQLTQTITVVNANSYTVTVTDANGCTNTDNVILTVNANPVPVITGNNVICQGQFATFSAASPGYTYLWSTGQVAAAINVTNPGPYTVTVTDPNGCTGITGRTLTVNANPVPVITGVNEFCQGQSRMLNAGPGFSGYVWSNGLLTQSISVSTGGTYTVTVTSANGCTGIDNEIVTVNPLPNPIITGSLDFCQGFNTTLDAGAGYTNYVWSTGVGTQTVTVNSAMNVTVTVTDVNGCIDDTTVTTIVNPNPIPNITGTMTTCQGSTTTIDAGPGYTYLWSTGQVTQTINVGTAGPVVVTVTDPNGCIGTDNTNITVFALPVATMSGIDTICAGASTTIQVNFSGPGPYTYYYWDGANQGPFTTGSAVANISVTPGATTNYHLVSVNNNNCTGTISGTANVRVTPLPTAQILGTTDICDGSSTNLSINFTGVAPYTYSYTVGATVFGPFTTSNDPETITVTPTNTTTYGLTATLTGAGCLGNTNPATAIVTVNDLPSAIITGDNTICDGTATDLTFSFVGAGPYTYTYTNGITNFGPFNSLTSPAVVSVSPSDTTSYTLVTISDSNCPGSGSGSADIIVNPLPTANMQGTAAICDGNDTDLTVVFTGNGPYTYSYNDGPNVYGPFTTNVNPILINVSPATSTIYGITTISDSNCPGTGSGTANITVIPLPTSDLTGSTEICRGSNTNMVLDFTGVAPFEYMYSDNFSNTFGPFTVNTYSTTINVAPVNNTSYHVTTLTGSGCPGTPAGTVDIVVNNIPEATLAVTGDNVLCAGESSQLTINFNGVSPHTYSYTDGNGNNFGPFTTANTAVIIPVTPSATSNYSLMTYSDTKCIGTMAGTALVTVNPLPTALVSGTPSICLGSSTSFTVGFTGTGPFEYSYSDGLVTYGPYQTSNNPETVNVAPTISTSYNVVTISDANCVGSASGVADVTVNQIPSAIISGDAEICIGTTTNINIAFNGVAPYIYTYTNGSSNFGPFNSPTSPVSIPVNLANSTTYTLVSLTDANCPGTLSGNAEIIVNPLPLPVISGDFEICDGESSVLSAQPDYVIYSWSNGPSTPSIVSTTPGIYTVTVTDINGCVGTSPAINMIVNQTPVVSFTNDTSLTCEIPEVNFYNTSTYPAGSEFMWDFGDSNTSTASNPSHIFSQPGSYPISLTIVTTEGCTSTLIQPVDIMFYPLPEAKFTPAPKVTNVFNGRVELNDESQYAVTWLWDLGDGAQSNSQNTSHYFNEIGEYKITLTVTNIAGCVDQYEDIVVVNPFYIPNAFTPNADGVNDYFFDAGYVLDVQTYNLSIFDRWGGRVYVGDNYNEFWDGYTKDGSKAPEGVYLYSIKVVTKGGKEHLFHGTVTLVR